MGFLTGILRKAYGIVEWFHFKAIVGTKISVMKYKWKKSGNIFVADDAMVFTETRLATLSKGMIRVGSKSCIRGSLEIQRENGEIHVGEDCYIGDGTRVWSAAKIVIGNRVLIAHNCNIFDNDTHPVDAVERRDDAVNIIWNGVRKNYPSLKAAPIVIGDDAWIGCNSIILKGVTIGEKAVVGSGSVVTKDVPAGAVVAGNPAKVIRYIEQ